MVQWSSDREFIARLNLRKNASEVAEYDTEGRLLRLVLRRPSVLALPQEFWQLSGLQDLKLQLFNDWINSAPSEIGLSPEIGRLSHLQRLDLSYTHLAALPTEFGQLAHLRALDLSGNRFLTIPPAVLQLPNLQALFLHANPLSVIPPKLVNSPIYACFLYQASLPRCLQRSGNFLTCQSYVCGGLD